MAVEALVEITRQTTALLDVSILATKSDLATEIAGVRSELAQSKSELKAEIAVAKVQAITIILSGMAVITAAGAALGKLLH